MNLAFSLKNPPGTDCLLNLPAYSVTADLITGKEYIAPKHAALASILCDFGVVIVKLKKSNETAFIETNLFDTDEITDEKNIKVLFYIFENASIRISKQIDKKTGENYTDVSVSPYSKNFCNLSIINDKEKFIEELTIKKNSLKSRSQLITLKSGEKVNFPLNNDAKIKVYIEKIIQTLGSPTYLKYQ